jgi:hypothetical protein
MPQIGWIVTSNSKIVYLRKFAGGLRTGIKLFKSVLENNNPNYNFEYKICRINKKFLDLEIDTKEQQRINFKMLK